MTLEPQERDLLCHVLAEERTMSLPLHERFDRGRAAESLIGAGLLARPAGGSPYLMLTETGRTIAEGIG